MIGQCYPLLRSPVRNFSCLLTRIAYHPSCFIREGKSCSVVLIWFNRGYSGTWQILWHFLLLSGSVSKKRRKRWKIKRWVHLWRKQLFRYDAEFNGVTELSRKAAHVAEINFLLSLICCIYSEFLFLKGTLHMVLDVCFVFSSFVLSSWQGRFASLYFQFHIPKVVGKWSSKVQDKESIG